LLVPAAEAVEDGSEQFVLVAGHRRHAGCIAAKHDPVESIIRRDLDSEGAQVIAMLTENGPRDDLTPIEEAKGYQLALSLNRRADARPRGPPDRQSPGPDSSTGVASRSRSPCSWTRRCRHETTGHPSASPRPPTRPPAASMQCSSTPTTSRRSTSAPTPRRPS